MTIKAKRRILYFVLFLVGLWLFVQIGGWWGGFIGIGGPIWAGALITEKLGWRRADTANDAFEYWSDAKKQEAANYGDSLNAILVAMLAKLAKLDGKVTKAEIEAVERILCEIDIVGDARTAAVKLFQEAKNGPLSFYDTVLIAKHHTGPNTQVARLIMLFLIQLGHADGSISEHIREALQDASTTLGFHYEEILEAHFASNKEGASTPNRPSRTDNAYDIMGCTPTDSDSAIKTKYRELAKTFHPDTIASKALPPEFTKFAEERFKQIQEAYETIVASRNTSQSA